MNDKVMQPASNNINLLGADEQGRRLERVYAAMRAAGIESGLVRTNANLYYLTGRVFRGYMLISPSLARPVYFLRQPTTLVADEGETIHLIRKPEDMAQYLTSKPALELDAMAYSEAMRIGKALGIDAPANISPVLRIARSVKTAVEQELIREAGRKHTLVYEQIPGLYREGMSDVDLQIEIERLSRKEGCLGQFRAAGGEMEIFMGSVLTGDNADAPSPYDFAMGGAGLHPSLPIGADGTTIEPGVPVMVDTNGNFTGYMTDMTRCFYTGELSDKAMAANELSAAICRRMAEMMIPGAKAADLYAEAYAMAVEAGFADYFMGHNNHAGFVGHGLGIEINEAPVLAPRSRDILEPGNVIAVEPKFVIPGIGAIGIENTYIVGLNGGEAVTTAPQEPVKFIMK